MIETMQDLLIMSEIQCNFLEQNYFAKLVPIQFFYMLQLLVMSTDYEKMVWVHFRQKYTIWAILTKIKHI